MVLRPSSSTAASKREISFTIFQQCILKQSLDADEILGVVGDDFQLRPSLFDETYASEADFNEALFEHINPRLQNAGVRCCGVSVAIWRLTPRRFRGQIRPESCVCSGAGMTELVVKTIAPHCSVAESKIDVALMSASQELLLGMIELKINLSQAALETAQLQTVRYALSALAYSRWGVRGGVRGGAGVPRRADRVVADGAGGQDPVRALGRAGRKLKPWAQRPGLSLVCTEALRRVQDEDVD